MSDVTYDKHKYISIKITIQKMIASGLQSFNLTHQVLKYSQKYCNTESTSHNMNI